MYFSLLGMMSIKLGIYPLLASIHQMFLTSLLSYEEMLFFSVRQSFFLDL